MNWQQTFFNICYELVTTNYVSRIPEPELVMQDDAHNKAYKQAGDDDGVMRPTILLHALLASEQIKKGDTVLDLACGPCNQLGFVAKICNSAKFIGIDLSASMLELGKNYCITNKIDNIDLRNDDMTILASVEDSSVDCVFSTMSLHHLPSVDDLLSVFKQIKRVLKPNGKIYLADFARLKREKTMEFMAYQNEQGQSPEFTLDYYNSLKAAFSLKEFENLIDIHFSGRVKIYSTFLVPFMTIIKTRENEDDYPHDILAATDFLDEMNKLQRHDFSALMTFFRLGGVKMNSELKRYLLNSSK